MVALMFYLNWRFTLIALLVAPVLFVEVYSLTRRIKSAARDLRKKESEIVSVVEESLSSIRVVKASAREDYEEKTLDRESRASMEIALRARSIRSHRRRRHGHRAVVRRTFDARGRTYGRSPGRLSALPRQVV
jgi:subfamily B ATP-binding cassette protein MsbA